jgi:membrane-bound serine protease (ClpP class)
MVAHASGAHIDHVTFDQDINPGSARFLDSAIDAAQSDGATLLIISLDTPGGDLTSMKAIYEKELASSVPIAVYVSPQGAYAASAGMFVALAAPIVAMAPNTRIGASSPIDSSGQDLGPTLDQKIKNDLDAELRAIQGSYGRDAVHPQQAVDSAASFDNQEALADGMITLESDSLEALIGQLDNYQGKFSNQVPFVLHTAGLPVQELQESFFNQVVTVFLDPNVLFLLFIVAAVCIYLELSHPGAIVPGTVGAIALVLFLFGAQALSPNWTGFILMLLGIALLAIDVRVPTHGVLTFGALISLALGSFIFFDTGVNQGASSSEVSPLLIAGLVVGVGVVSLLVLRFAIRSQRMGKPAGLDSLIGQRATVLVALAPEGRIRVLGEDWAARLAPGVAVSTPRLEVGTEVRVVGVDGLKLIVEPV